MHTFVGGEFTLCCISMIAFEINVSEWICNKNLAVVRWDGGKGPLDVFLRWDGGGVSGPWTFFYAGMEGGGR